MPRSEGAKGGHGCQGVRAAKGGRVSVGGGRVSLGVQSGGGGSSAYHDLLGAPADAENHQEGILPIGLLLTNDELHTRPRGRNHLGIGDVDRGTSTGGELATVALALDGVLRVVLIDGLAVELEGLLLEPRGDRARAEAVCASTNVRKGERFEEGSRILRSGEGSGAHSRRGAGGSRASAWPVARRRPAGTRSGRCSPSSPGPCAPGSNEPPCPSRGRSRRGRHGSPWCRTWGGSPTASGTWTPPGGSRRRPQWSRRGARSPSSKLRRES